MKSIGDLLRELFGELNSVPAEEAVGDGLVGSRGPARPIHEEDSVVDDPSTAPSPGRDANAWTGRHDTEPPNCDMAEGVPARRGPPLCPSCRNPLVGLGREDRLLQSSYYGALNGAHEGADRFGAARPPLGAGGDDAS